MSRKPSVRITPVTPCCDQCVTSAFQRAGFDYTEPFSVVSGFAGLSAKARRDFVESVVANAAANVVLVVSDPVPAHLREEREEKHGADPAVTPSDDAAPTPDDLADLLGLDGEQG